MIKPLLTAEHGTAALPVLFAAGEHEHQQILAQI